MVISQTPLRISLTGGGTDFEDYYRRHKGFVISTTINKYIYVIVKERFDNKIGAYYFNSETVSDISELRHDLIREAALKAGLKTGFDVSILTDIPSDGSGLGSSSSLTVGLLNAFSTYRGLSLSTKELADKACQIEIDILKKPIGKQDQYAAAFGGINAIIFETDGKVWVEKLPLSTLKKREIDSNLMLYFTNITRKSSSILTEQKENIDSKIEELNKLQEISRKLYAELVVESNVDYIGEALNTSWLVKQKLAKNITNEEITEIWKKAMGNGASGGKISGAGGGGFLLLYVRKEAQDQLRKALSNYFEFPFMIEERGSRIIFDLPSQTIK